MRYRIDPDNKADAAALLACLSVGMLVGQSAPDSLVVALVAGVMAVVGMALAANSVGRQ